MIIFDNFTTPSHQTEISDILDSQSFPWFKNARTLNPAHPNFRVYPDTLDTQQFIHSFKSSKGIDSNFYYIIHSLVVLLEKELKIDLQGNILRAKANLITRDSSYPVGKYNQPHTDWPDNNTNSLIYYVQDSDGDTVIFNEKDINTKTLTVKQRIRPVKGRAVYFNSQLLHASTSPKNTENRIVINIVFKS